MKLSSSSLGMDFFLRMGTGAASLSLELLRFLRIGSRGAAGDPLFRIEFKGSVEVTGNVSDMIGLPLRLLSGLLRIETGSS